MQVLENAVNIDINSRAATITAERKNGHKRSSCCGSVRPPSSREAPSKSERAHPARWVSSGEIRDGPRKRAIAGGGGIVIAYSASC
jgi:hypothetical protein